MQNLRKIQDKSRQRVVSLPTEALDALGADAGDYVSLAIEDGEVIIRRARIVIDGEGGTQ